MCHCVIKAKYTKFSQKFSPSKKMSLDKKIKLAQTTKKLLEKWVIITIIYGFILYSMCVLQAFAGLFYIGIIWTTEFDEQPYFEQSTYKVMCHLVILPTQHTVAQHNIM